MTAVPDDPAFDGDDVIGGADYEHGAPNDEHEGAALGKDGTLTREEEACKRRSSGGHHVHSRD